MELAHLKITKGTGKLANMHSLNVNTASNEFCKAMHSSPDSRVICKTCYSLKALRTYRKNCAVAWQHNSDQLSQPLKDWQLLRVNQLYFRFSSHGELINESHSINLFRICEVNPRTTFVLMTKRHKIIYKALKTHKLPDNLILIYSNPIKDRVMTKPPKRFHKVFNVTESLHSQDNCTGNSCFSCLKCYSFDSERVIVEREK